MHFAKIDVLIFIISTIALRPYCLTLRFVANTFLMRIFWKLHQLESRNFLQEELKYFQNNRNKKIAKFLTLSSRSAV